MKRYILLAGCLALAVGATPRSRTNGVPSFADGGNPRFQDESTWCAVGDTEAVCRLTVVGVGRSREAEITLDVLARRVYSCVSATGEIVTGQTEKAYIGSARQVSRSQEDGTVEDVIRGELYWEVTRDAALLCPPTYRVVPGSESTEASWQLTAVGPKRAGLFNAAYTSM